MIDNFYRAFEDRHRGSRELIKGRLKTYLPFIQPLTAFYPGASAVDLGCGRGEWLEILSSTGYQPIGVDLDQGMLEACVDLGLTVRQGEAVSFLTALPDESQVVVSAFHVVEHIGFDQLRSLVREAMRVLKPGGLLIMETPNPENLVVATRNFYLDPTHQRPIPAELLSFVPGYYGFQRVKILGLQESRALYEPGRINLHDVFAGASPDYGVVAQKQGGDALMGALAPWFARDYGLTLEALAEKYDRGLVQAIKAESDRVLQVALDAQAEVRAIRSSHSWRITAPLRWAGIQARKIRDVLGRLPSWRDPFDWGLRWVARRPAIKRMGRLLLRPFPGVLARVRERRAAQIRMDFLAHSMARIEKARQPGSPGCGTTDILALVAEKRAPLSVDEILVRIRKEVADLDGGSSQ